MSYDKIYNDIKKSLVDIYQEYTTKYTNRKNRTTSDNEYFSINFLPIPSDDTFLNDTSIPIEIRMLNILPSELYIVIEKFDLEPSELTDSEKKLRLKYLDIASKLIENNFQKIYDNTRNTTQYPFQILDKDIILSNLISSKNLTLRIIKLLKEEVTSGTVTSGTVTPGKPIGYIVTIIILFILLTIAFAVIINKKKM